MSLSNIIICVLEDLNDCVIVADFLEEFHSNHAEFEIYHKRFQNPKSLRLQTIIDVLCKFGTKKERHVGMKAAKKCWTAYGARKGAVLASMKKLRWFVSYKHHISQVLKNECVQR